MKSCKNCFYNNGTAVVGNKDEPCWTCLTMHDESEGDFPKWESADKKQTNADRFFRNVTNEQLAQYMDEIASCEFCPARRERCGYGHGCIDAWLEWLKQEDGE